VKTKMIAAFALLFVIPVLASAQSEPRSITSDISFPFSVGKASLPAGTYAFKADLQTKIVTVTNKKTGQSVMANITTRLSARSQTDSLVVFDKTADQYILSEVYFAGIDGFCFAGAAGEHTHANVVGR
jgi:hypothetical protein